MTKRLYSEEKMWSDNQVLKESNIYAEPKQTEIELVILGLKKPSANIKHKRWLIYPDENKKVAWDIFISLILLFSCFITPFDLAFPNIVEEYQNYRIMGNVIDIIFLIDIFVNFASAYQDNFFNLVDNRKQIVMNYLKGWFIIDIIAILPFDLIL